MWIKRSIACVSSSSWMLLAFLSLAPVQGASADWGPQITGITATSPSNWGDRTALKAVNSSGLSGISHNIDPSNMWLENGPVVGAAITVDLTAGYRVGGLKIWNYNEQGSYALRGFKRAKIEYSLDGINWIVAMADQALTSAPGAAGYDTPDVIDLVAVCRYIRMTCLENYGDTGYAGLSEIQVFAEDDLTPVEGPLTPVNASSDNPGFNRLAKYAVDGSGLIGGGHTNVAGTTMWLENPPAVNASITVDMGRLCYIAELSVWNYNEAANLGFGIKRAKIEVSSSGIDWTVIYSDVLLSQATGAGNYAATDVLPVDATCQFVRITCLESYHGVFQGEEYAGLSEIGFSGYAVPGVELVKEQERVLADSNRPWNLARRAVDGSGLNGMQCGTNPSDIWIEALNGARMYVDFGELVRLQRMLIWNENEAGLTSRGIRRLKIETSVDESDWTVCKEAQWLTEAPGDSSYNTPDTVLPDSEILCRYVRFTVIDTWGATDYTGLSEVKFFVADIACEPIPESAFNSKYSRFINDGSMDASWTPASWAASHDFYFGSSYDAVESATTNSSEFRGNVSVPNWDFGPMYPYETYYWRVDEVNGTTNVKGVVWSFNANTEPREDHSPNPINYAEGIQKQTNITWAAVEGTDFQNVYWGTNYAAVAGATPQDPEFKGAYTNTTYTPQNLNDYTVYYWRADSVDSTIPEIYPGETMEFRTIPELTWTAGEGTDFHNVYFGTNYDAVVDAAPSSPEFIGTTMNTSFYPETLDDFTTYFWRADGVSSPAVTKSVNIDTSPFPLGDIQLLVRVSDMNDTWSDTNTITLSVLGPEADQDADQLPDWWELEYFQSETNANPSVDSDQDGANNLAEFIAGTDPTNSTSLFSVTISFDSAITQTNSNIVLHWEDVSNRVYSVFSADDLDATFNKTSPDLFAPTNTYTSEMSGASSNMFYKIGVELASETGTGSVVTLSNGVDNSQFITSDKPTVSSLSLSTNPVYQGSSTLFTANNMLDPDGIKTLEVYADLNGNGIPEAGELIHIETDTDVPLVLKGKTWEFTVSDYSLDHGIKAPENLNVIRFSNLTPPQSVTLQTIAGVTARLNRPEIFIEDNKNYMLLDDLAVNYGITYTRNDDFWWYVENYKDDVNSQYILYDISDPHSMMAAASLAGIFDMAAVDVSLESGFISRGYALLVDVRGKDEVWVYNNYWNYFTDRSVIAANINQYLMDWSCAVKSMMTVGISKSFSDQLYDNIVPNSPRYGAWELWATGKNDNTTLMSEHGMYSGNFANTLTVPVYAGMINHKPEISFEQKIRSETYSTEPGVHYVTFIMSDMDNTELLTSGAWFNPNYNHPRRGSFNMGWAMSPVMFKNAPTAAEKFYRTASDKDCFISCLSGMAFMYPSEMPQATLNKHCQQLGNYMQRGDLRITLVQDWSWINSAYLNNVMAPYMEIDHLDAIIFDDGSQTLNRPIWYMGKPIIPMKHALWEGIGTSSSVAAAINAKPTAPTSLDSYSVVYVHTWTRDLDDVFATIELLDDNVRVVTPEELVQQIYLNNAN